MLVLSRNPGQSVIIGHDIVVTVLEVRGDVVRIGIDAPREVDVHREEVYKELQQSNREAALPADVEPRIPSRPARPASPAAGPVKRPPSVLPTTGRPPVPGPPGRP